MFDHNDKNQIIEYEWCGIVELKYLSKPAILAALLLQNKLRLGLSLFDSLPKT